ncbi:HAD family phosphatase [Streptomyces sp. TRM66268-LWL]|uniref:HAD family phosphatase n=1 Tax=Streptomyces polyasparticus TaxID=2767826 RepID=A0ABR7SSJ5_9ACTN|nr:HAD family phosphatase [Streptomyces polyasparticus]MBC9718429.1 HAD family phosphatase [Streptomyces polyasparticus]
MNNTPPFADDPRPDLAAFCAHALPDDVSAVIFDFDGTLADTTPGHEAALREALAPYDIELKHDWYLQHVGLSVEDLLTALPGGRRLPHHTIIHASRALLLSSLDAIAPLPCTVSLLGVARQAELPCAVASGASRVLVFPGLQALGLADKFAAIVAREDAEQGKPAPDLYLEAARRLNVPAKRCLAVDDAPDGIASARAAGMRVLTIKHGHLSGVAEARTTTTSAGSSSAARHPRAARRAACAEGA